MFIPFISKRRHEAETESLRDEISRLRGARMMDAETIRQQDARHRKAVTDLAAQSDEIDGLKADLELADAVLVAQKRDVDALRPDAEKWRARAAREKARGERRKGRGQ